MIKIGLTGGIGAGKSSVAIAFNALGYPVYDSDEAAKKLMKTSLKNNIEKIIGENTFLENGELNKMKIANAIFNNKNKLNELNAIVHPEVQKDFQIWAKKQKTPIVIQEAAIMIESGAYKNLDLIIVVTAPMEIRIERAMKRDKVTKDFIIAKINNQISENENIKHADFVIDTYDDFITKQVMDIIKKILPLHHKTFLDNL